MPGSTTSVFSDAEDFEAALREEGCLGLLVTGPGQFRARLTQLALHRLRLSAADERLPRIALVAVPADTILVSLPKGNGPAPIWGGSKIGSGEIMTLGSGERLHMRSDGPCRWGSIWLPAAELLRYGGALTGAALSVPSAPQSWRPWRAIIRHLHHLHSAAIGHIESRSNALLDDETAHGLEQQLIHAVVECLATGSAIEAAPPTRRDQDVALRFEALLQGQPKQGPLKMAEICAVLGVSALALSLCCEEQLGMGPAEYLRRRRMQLAHRALRHGNADGANVSDIARRYGFRGLGRFAADYRALYGELPSATLQRGLRRGTRKFALGRSRRKLLVTALT
jgi:AraC-like DNA-binding protein